MTILFSPATGGFYHPALDYLEDLPADGVAITAQQHTALLDGLSTGQVITMQNGSPVLTPRVPTRPQLVQAIKAEAARRIELIAPLWRQLNDTRAPTPESAARFAAIDQVRAASDLIELDLEETETSALAGFPVTDHPMWPAPFSQEDN